MHLKRLIVHGFKSFADRTEFEFTRGGLTCIVGPNGCGKSNVIDAVKWVLGEQRPTSLRGKEMTDVIFNGTVRRPPMGLCEGTLVFDNDSKILPVDEPEVRLTRRVYRTGETEYLVNGRAARLKDLRDLFAGTGLGTGGYAFMEQGKIDSILASNAVERRRVFEEAAGISRFRARKHEAELKFAKVEENLTRLADVVEEVGRQVRSLRVHAGKARSWRELTERVRVLQRRFALHRYANLISEGESVATRVGELSAGRESLARRRDGLREALHEVEAELERLLEGVSDARAGFAEVTGQLAAAREKITFHERYRAEVEERGTQKRSEIEDSGRKLASLREEAVVLLREQEGLERDLVRTAGRRGLEEQQVEAVRGRGAELESVRAGAEAAVRRLDEDLAGIIRDEARLEAEIAHHQGRIASIQAGRARLEEARSEHRRSLDDRTGHQDAQTTALEERRLALTGEERRSEDFDRALAEAADELRRIESELGRMQARRDVIQGHLRRREGLDEGTRIILEEVDRRPGFLPGFRGLLLDLFDVDLVEARAVEAALGELASAIVVSDAAEALEGLRFLRGRGAAGGLFLPLDRFVAPHAQLPPALGPSSPEIAAVLAALLGGIEIVEREEFELRIKAGACGEKAGACGASDDRAGTFGAGVIEARTCGAGDVEAGACGAGMILASTGGDVFRDGRIVQGPRGGDASPGLVVLQSELKDLERRLPAVSRRRDEVKTTLAETRAARDASRVRVKELSLELLKEEGEAARLDQEIVRLVRELDRLNEEAERLREEEAGAIQAREQSHLRLLDSRAARAAADEDRNRARRELEMHRERTVAHGSEMEQALAALHAAQMEEARCVERLETIKGRSAWLASTTEDLARRMEASRREIEDLERGAADTARTLAVESERIQALEQKASETRAALDERERAADGVREDLRSVSEQLDAAESEISGLADRMASARGREGEVRAALENLLAHARDELGFDLVEAWAAGERPPLTAEESDLPSAAAEPGAAVADSGAQADGGIPPEGDPAASDTSVIAAASKTESSPGAPIDWKAVEALIRELRERIVRLGNVNHAAIDELEAAEKRAEFLERERLDLEHGREELKKVLKSIETQSTAMFLETFNAVREHFTVIFRKLFGGGKADMALENPELPLESGIEIKARPPGKELRSITLLSGGERSMTAVALLFAIFKAHPAPCAFMDEVDAALDEDNTERFVRLVSESREQAQFIVVTHSKRTMEYGDLLYGVTMPERGVSRRVAVRLEHIDEQGQIRDLSEVESAAAAEAQHRSAPEEDVRTPAAAEEPAGEAAVPNELPADLEVPALARRARPRVRKVPGPPPEAPPAEASAGEAGA